MGFLIFKATKYKTGVFTVAIIFLMFLIYNIQNKTKTLLGKGNC